MNQSIALPNPAVEVSLDLNTLPFENNLYDAYFYHSDHLGSSNYISNNTGIVSQHTEYLPFGETFVDEHLNSHNTPFKFNAKELDDETGNYYYGARYYNPKWSTWLSVDPLAEQTMDAYGYCYQNPLRFTDPTGMSPNPGEYERDSNGNWQKVSPKGDDEGLDYYHTDDIDEDGNENCGAQITHVTDNKNNWNTINKGREVLSGQERGNGTNWESIYKEWKNGTGPARSYFGSSHAAIKDIEYFYSLGSAKKEFKESGLPKKKYEIDFYPIWDNWLVAHNMQLQMMGSFNVSFYDLGDSVLTIVQDSKSRTSFYYHLPFIVNHERGQKISYRLSYSHYPMIFCMKPCLVNDKESNTYQTYIFVNKK